MEVKIDQKVIDTACNSLRASQQSLKNQLRNATDVSKKAIIESQLKDVEEALGVFIWLES